MTRRDLPSRTRTRLAGMLEVLDRTGQRVPVLVAGAVGVLGLHLWLGDPRVVWLTALLVLLVGLSTPVRFALGVAAVLAVSHGAVDIVLGLRPVEVFGLTVRTLVLPGLALAGSIGTDLERQRHRAMERAVSEDPVTGLLNVRVFYDELARRRDRGETFTILFADLRGMRDLNERHGHPTGTEAMRVLAHVLRRAAGPDAYLARLGSDEIAVLLPGSDRERCREVVDTAVRRLASERVRLPDGEPFAVHASYGIAVFPDDGPDEVAVLSAADHAKEEAKVVIRPGGRDPLGVAGSHETVDAGAEAGQEAEDEA